MFPHNRHFVKCKFLNRDGTPQGRDYTYGTTGDMSVGEVVQTDAGKRLVVIATDITEAEIPPDVLEKIKLVYPVDQAEAPADGQNAQMTLTDAALVTPAAVVQMDYDSAITVDQLPIITERLAAIGAEVDRRVSEALALECTEDTVRRVKEARAALNKDSSEIEIRRKRVKAEIMAPYDRFEAVYKRLILDKYRDADSRLKDKIVLVEEAAKFMRRKELTAYFDEYRQSLGIDASFITIERWGPNVTLSASMKSLKDAVREYLDGISRSLSCIASLENKDDVLLEYQKCLILSQAISIANNRREALEALKRRQEASAVDAMAKAEAVQRVETAIAAQDPAPLAPAVAVIEMDTRLYTAAFRVTATREKLKALKQFLIDWGYVYEC